MSAIPVLLRTPSSRSRSPRVLTRPYDTTSQASPVFAARAEVAEWKSKCLYFESLVAHHIAPEIEDFCAFVHCGVCMYDRANMVV